MNRRLKAIFAWAAFALLAIALFTNWLPGPAEWAVIIVYGAYLVGFGFLPPSWRRKLKRKWQIVVRG